jgi:hypothetical protein
MAVLVSFELLEFFLAALAMASNNGLKSFDGVEFRFQNVFLFPPKLQPVESFPDRT